MSDYPKEDCYETLGVHPEASQDLIESTWKKLNGIYHPDLKRDEPLRDQLAAEEKLKKINAAHEVLKDSQRRKAYDQWRNAKLQPPKPSANRRSVDFGTLDQGESRTERVLVENNGGPVVGEINFSLLRDPSNFRLSIDAANGFPIVVDISIDTSDLDVDRSLSDTLTISLDGNDTEVRLSARVRSASVDTSPHPPVVPTVPLTPPPPSVATPVASPVSSVSPSVSPAGMSRGWAIGLGWLAGFVFLKIIGPLVALILTSAFPQTVNGPGWLGLIWIVGCSILFGVLVTSILRGMKGRAGGAALLAVLLTMFTAIVLAVTTKHGTDSHVDTAVLPVEDKLAGSSIGVPAGIRWTNALGNRGAVFSAADFSRIEYPGTIPSEGTLEFWIKVDSGYQYANYQFKGNQDEAMIFSSDVHGGDVTWPGTTKIFVSRDGALSIWMATIKGENHVPATEARKTKFRFGEWHAIGVSYGKQGQYIMLDGDLVASAPSRTQTFGAAGNQQTPLDIPTIGDTVSHFWAPHQYEGGFEGVLTAFRVSSKQLDWEIAKGISQDGSTGGDVPPTQTSVEDQREHELVQHATELLASHDFDGALVACNEALTLNADDLAAVQLKKEIQDAMKQSEKGPNENTLGISTEKTDGTTISLPPVSNPPPIAQPTSATPALESGSATELPTAPALPTSRPTFRPQPPIPARVEIRTDADRRGTLTLFPDHIEYRDEGMGSNGGHAPYGPNPDNNFVLSCGEIISIKAYGFRPVLFGSYQVVITARSGKYHIPTLHSQPVVQGIQNRCGVDSSESR